MDARVRKMAEIIINYSTAVKPGDQVLIRSLSPAGTPLVEALYQEALKAGGKAYTYVHLSEEDVLAVEATDNVDLLSEANPMLQMMYETSDVVIRIESTENPFAMAEYPAEKQSARRKAKYAPIAIQMEREGKGQLRRCTTQFPTMGYAQAAGMSLRQYEDFLFGACKVHLDDPVAAWKALETEHMRLVNWLAGKKHLQVHGANIDMELSLENRKFISAHGTSNFPDGEIFTGPVEQSVNGWVRFTYPGIYEGNVVQGVELKFEEGKVVKATAEKGEAFLNGVLDTDAGSRYLGEFAIGTNMDIQRFTGSILFDEKIGGTIHMALGQGYAETGNNNKSGIHWDLICDMHDGGEIVVDGEVIYKNGAFVI